MSERVQAMTEAAGRPQPAAASSAADAPSDRPWQALVLALIVVFVALTFGPALLGHGTQLDVGALRRSQPFNAALGPLPQGMLTCRSDTLESTPGIINTVEAVRHGNWQTWAPYEVGGDPLASVPNHAVLSPISWSYWLLPFWLAPAFVLLTELLVVVAGMTALLGRLGVRRSAGLLAGFVFFTSGFMMMWSGWPHTKVAPFIPALLWALDRTVVDRGARNVALVALVVASMLFGGFPAVTLFALTLGAVYVVVRSLRLGGRRQLLGAWVCSASGVALGAALASVQLLPFVRTLGLALEDRTGFGPWPASHVLTVLAPGLWGTCADGSYTGGLNPIEGIYYVGAGAFVLAVCALVVRLPSDRRPGAPVLWGVLLACAVWLIWVGGEPLRLLQQLPGYDTGKIGRASSVFGFLVAVLAGFGFHRLLVRARAGDTTPGASQAPRWWGVVAVAVVLALAAAYFGHATLAEARVEGNVRVVERRLVTPGILLLVAVAAAVATYLLPRRLRLVGPAVLVILVFAQATSFVRTVLPTSDRTDFYPVTTAHAFLQEHIGHDRYGGEAGWGRPATSDFYHLRTPVGHEFTTLAWKDVLAAISPATLRSRTYSAFPALPTSEVGREPLLDQLSVRYWATPPADVSGVRENAPLRHADGSVSVASGERVTCTLPGGPLRGVTVLVRDQVERSRRTSPALVHVRVQQGGVELTGSRSLPAAIDAGKLLAIAVPGEELPDAADATVEVWFSGLRRPVELASRGGEADCGAVRPRPDDGLRLVHADAGSVIYERLTALPRIRWAGRSQVVTDRAARIAMLKTGVPADTVLLDSDATPPATGSTATVEVVGDEPETITVDVSASADGYVVVADSVTQPGWAATVDGRPAPLVPGNHAFGAVPVSAGDHRLVLHYTAPGLRAGAIVSLVAGVVVLGLLALPLVTRRRRKSGNGDASP